MQTKGQRKRPKKWKIVAGLGAGAALGFAGIAFAGSGDYSGVPAPITLQHQVVAGESLPPSTTSRVTLTTSGSTPHSPGTTLFVAPTVQRSTPLSPTTTPPHVASAQRSTPLSPSTTLPATRAANQNDIDCSLDDCSLDSQDCALDDCSPDAPDAALDDASDSTDCVDSSIDS
jgi:hypothetical protein